MRVCGECIRVTKTDWANISVYVVNDHLDGLPIAFGRVCVGVCGRAGAAKTLD